MKPLELWRWRLHDAVTGRPYTSRFDMTEADALNADPLAVRLPYSLQARLVPENDDEMDRLRASSILVPKTSSPIPCCSPVRGPTDGGLLR
jgi:hypothetical protein